MIGITLITILVSMFNLKKSHKKDLTIFKRRSGQRKVHRKSVGLDAID
jgi:hypothetical protein